MHIISEIHCSNIYTMTIPLFPGVYTLSMGEGSNFARFVRLLLVHVLYLQVVSDMYAVRLVIVLHLFGSGVLGEDTCSSAASLYDPIASKDGDYVIAGIFDIGRIKQVSLRIILVFNISSLGSNHF